MKPNRSCAHLTLDIALRHARFDMTWHDGRWLPQHIYKLLLLRTAYSTVVLARRATSLAFCDNPSRSWMIFSSRQTPRPELRTLYACRRSSDHNAVQSRFLRSMRRLCLRPAPGHVSYVLRCSVAEERGTGIRPAQSGLLCRE